MIPVGYETDQHFPLEELLIDFLEMVGEHSGENMAEEVWDSVEMYGQDTYSTLIHAEPLLR